MERLRILDRRRQVNVKRTDIFRRIVRDQEEDTLPTSRFNQEADLLCGINLDTVQNVSNVPDPFLAGPKENEGYL